MQEIKLFFQFLLLSGFLFCGENCLKEYKHTRHRSAANCLAVFAGFCYFAAGVLTHAIMEVLL